MVSEIAKSRPWMLILLVVSLGLNLFLGGLMAGRWFSGPPYRAAAAMTERGPAGEPNRILQRMADSLPPEDRPVFETIIAKHREGVLRAAGEARDAREIVRAVLRKEPFDRAALDRAFEDVRKSNAALQLAIQSTIGEAAAQLPPEARQRLADWRAHGRRP
jgi:uncharacterized membrane protein